MGKDKKKKEKDKSKKKQKSGKALKKNREVLQNENVVSQKESDVRYDWHDWDDDDDEDGIIVGPEDREIDTEPTEVPSGDAPEPKTAQTKEDNATGTTQSDTENASGDIEKFPADRKNPVITNGGVPKARRRKKQTPVEGDTSAPSPDQVDQVQGSMPRVSVEKITDAAVLAIFQALSDENRVKIMNLLAEREMCTSELLEAVNVVQSTMSHHMKVLCDAGLVSTRRVGKRSCYAVRRDTLDRMQAYLEGWKA